jgi:hypothetical protein
MEPNTISTHFTSTGRAEILVLLTKDCSADDNDQVTHVSTIEIVRVFDSYD